MDSNWFQNVSLSLLSPPSQNVSPSHLFLTNISPLPVHFSFHLCSFLLTLVKFWHFMMSPVPFPQSWSLFQFCFPSPWLYIIKVLTPRWHDGALRRKERRGSREESCGRRKRRVMNIYMKILLYQPHADLKALQAICQCPPMIFSVLLSQLIF